MSRELLSRSGEPLWAVDARVRRLEHRIDWLEQQVRYLTAALAELADAPAAGPPVPARPAVLHKQTLFTNEPSRPPVRQVAA